MYHFCLERWERENVVALRRRVQAPFLFVEASGTPLAIKRQGQGQPIICLHATGHGGRDFEGFAAAVTGKGFEAVIVDWPGQGASPPDQGKMPASAIRYAQILRALIPQLGLSQPPILLGNSIGAAAALSLAIEQPQIVKGLVLCNPGGLAPLTFVVRRGIGAMVWFFNRGAQGAGWFARAFALYYDNLVLPGVAAAEQRARIVAAGYENAGVMRDAWMSFGTPEADLRAAAQTLRVPCLFAWARRDRIVAWKACKEAVEAIPGAQVEMFEAGHAAFLEDADAFNRAFIDFAGRLRSTS